MRASPRMSKERADLVGRFGREDMLELAGLLLDFRLAIHGQAIGEETLGQAVTADDAAGAFASARVSSTIRVPSPIEAATGFSASWQGFTNGL